MTGDRMFLEQQQAVARASELLGRHGHAALVVPDDTWAVVHWTSVSTRTGRLARLDGNDRLVWPSHVDAQALS